MKKSLKLIHVLVAMSLGAPALAADAEAGKAKAMPCASCHGDNGISVSPAIPNLAGQKPAYVTAQLKAFRGGTRTNPMMQAIASQLSDQDIDNLAAFWSSLPGASTQTASAIPAHIERTRLKFPEGYQNGFVLYDTISFPDRNQVRKYYANSAAIEAARAGKPMPSGAYLFVEVFGAKMDADKKPVKGADGHFEADKLMFYTGMETQPGWGSEFPEMLRNGDWNYAVFLADKTVRPGVNQAECLACHKPLDQDSFLFTKKALQAKAAAAK